MTDVGDMLPRDAARMVIRSCWSGSRAAELLESRGMSPEEVDYVLFSVADAMEEELAYAIKEADNEREE